MPAADDSRPHGQLSRLSTHSSEGTEIKAEHTLLCGCVHTVTASGRAQSSAGTQGSVLGEQEQKMEQGFPSTTPKTRHHPRKGGVVQAQLGRWRAVGAKDHNMRLSERFQKVSRSCTGRTPREAPTEPHPPSNAVPLVSWPMGAVWLGNTRHPPYSAECLFLFVS